MKDALIWVEVPDDVYLEDCSAEVDIHYGGRSIYSYDGHDLIPMPQKKATIFSRCSAKPEQQLGAYIYASGYNECVNDIKGQKESSTKVIEIPSWAKIGRTIYVKDVRMLRGEDPDALYAERIISYSENGFYHKEYNCPPYHSYFRDLGRTIFLSRPVKMDDE